MLVLAHSINLMLASGRPCNANQILTRAAIASGVLPWNTEVVSQGTVSAAGFNGRFVKIAETHFGRSSTDVNLGVLSWRTVVGDETWQRDRSRGVHPLNSPNARAGTRTSRYVNRQGYLHPLTDPAKLTCLGQRNEDGRVFDIVAAVPAAGRPITLWVDGRTHLIRKILERLSTGVAQTQFDDYRQTFGFAVPFEVREGLLGDPVDDVRFLTQKVTLSRSIDRAHFAPPQGPLDTRFCCGRQSTVVPFSLEYGDIVVNASINGSRPMPFLLDTGGHAILTSEAARSLNVREVGNASSGGGGADRTSVRYAKVNSIRIGDAIVPNQTVLVIGYGKDFSDRTPRPSLAGILGLELFERFTVQVDYARSQLTLSRGRTRPSSKDRLPLYFQEDMPAAFGRVDEVVGLLDVDTGNSGGTIMYGPFLKRNGLLKRYASGAQATGSGTGGSVQSSVHVIKALSIGHHTFRNVVTYFVVNQHGGTFSSTAAAGNLGYDILARFNLTFDYEHTAMYLSMSAVPPFPVYGRSGLGFAKKSGNFTVVSIRRPSPALDSGLSVGDDITAVDSKPAATLAASDLWKIMRQRPGTLVRLTFVRKGRIRKANLKLRDMPVPVK